MDFAFYRSLVEKHKDAILEAERWIWKHPEPGYREFQTNQYLREKFEALGYTLQGPSDLTGFYTDIDTGRPGPKIMVLGELDAVPQPDHPEAVNGYAHACGHNVQCAALYGIALALKEPGALDGLSGTIRLMAIPAEESLEMSFREKLPELGIGYASGKVEYMRRGYMDGVDLAYMIHAHFRGEPKFDCNDSNGLMTETFTVEGKAAHSGSGPHKAVNALNAATLGIQGIHDARETFQEKDRVRVNTLITEGGVSVGAVPGKVKLTSQVRSASLESILDTLHKVERAMAGGALSVGAKLHIQGIGCNMPLHNSDELKEVAGKCMAYLVGREQVNMHRAPVASCTDMGDLSCIMPVMHAHVAGAAGQSHSASYQVTDPYTAAVLNATADVLIAAALLENDAAEAKRVIAAYQKPMASAKEYFALREKFRTERDAITYDEDGSVTVRF